METKLKDKIIETPLFNQTIDKDKNYCNYYDLWGVYRDRRNHNIRHISKDGIERNILDYVTDSVDRMNERAMKPSWKEDYQSNLFDPITRGKVISILSSVVQARMKAEPLLKRNSIYQIENFDFRQSVYSDILDSANEHNMDDYQLIFEMFTALTEGTVIGYEGWVKGSVEYDAPVDFNPDTGEIKTERVKTDEWDDVYGEIVPIDEFYPENIWVSPRDFYIKNKRCFRAREMTYEGFLSTYGGYEGAQSVRPAVEHIQDETLPWGIPNDTRPNNVFVLEYYDAEKKKKGLWANGRELYFDALPFIHGQLPFWIGIGEPIHQGLIFGKSLPDKLMGMQDVNNGLLNAMLDQLFLALNSPIFVDGLEDMADGYLEPGRMYELAPGGRVEKVGLGQVDQTAFQMYQLLKRSIEEQSISAQAQGVPTGGRKTKFEVQQIQESALQLAGLLIQLMEQAMKRKYWLRMYNVLQYYSMPSRDKSGKKKFKYIELKDRKLSNGKIGKRRIQIVGSKTDVPSKEELRDIAMSETGESEYDPTKANIEPLVITRDWLINKELDIEMAIVHNSSIKDSKVARQNRDIAFFQATLDNPNINQREVTKDFVRAFDKDVDRIMEPEQEGMPGMPMEMGGMPGMPGGTTGMPAPQINPDVL